MTKVNVTMNVRKVSEDTCIVDIQGEINAFAENDDCLRKYLFEK